ncbi:MAG TPA: enolase C-terminal domain-like protein [Miltoncostaeaceae bacterium]|nr:enolase C-terminal domain-like protein [Miltoncostaeaceae bacterium]
MSRPDATVEAVTAEAYRVPADAPESDGTLTWDATTIVVVRARGGGATGLGYTYCAAAAARLVEDVLADVVRGTDVMAPPRAAAAMGAAVRNVGRPGLASCAISAVDVALWDLKARLLGLALADLLGRARHGVPGYGSGGFTSLSLEELERQLGGWAAEGFAAVKMKVGRDPGRDPVRIRAARAAIGDDVALFIDANGACDPPGALALAEAAGAAGVTWFEEPVSSDDLEGMRLVRERAPAGMAVAAGEYGYTPWYFRRMAAAGAVDCMQADATRCGGVSGFMAVDALCDAFTLPLSAHTAPTVHAHLGVAAGRMRHIEWFHDHVEVERRLFDGVPEPVDGVLVPDPDRPGLGVELRLADDLRCAA